MRTFFHSRSFRPFHSISFLISAPGRKTHLALLLALSGLFLLVPAAVDGARPQRFHQDQEPEPLSGLIGSEIGDIAWSGRYLWVATENGLARLDPRQDSGLLAADWVTFTESNGLGRGAVSALDAAGDTVWTATLFDTTVAGIDPPPQVGDGLSFSLDSGRTWQHLSNEAIFDPGKPGFEKGPTTPIQNPCYGLSIAGDTVWAVFFAGSSVRSRDGGRTWERVLPDGAEEIVFFARETAADSLQIRADSLAQAGGPAEEIARLRTGADSLRSQEFLHRTFDVLAYGDTVWIGTASGIGRSFDGGRTWRNIKVRLDEQGNPISGHIAANWVVALERQILPDGRPVVWAGTRATGEGEVNAISFTRDHGQTWEITGPTSAWDFTFTENKVWAATDEGLFASPDQGRTWEQIEVIDGEPLRGTFIGLEVVDDILWVGSETGLGRSADEGRTWQIIRSLFKTRALDTGELVGEGGVPTSPDSTVATYAAPNPFSPSPPRSEQAAIVFSLTQDARVTVKIYDFASRLVRTLVEDEPFGGQQNHRVTWDGRDEDEDWVANGIYFYHIELDTGRQAFGKVVVLD